MRTHGPYALYQLPFPGEGRGGARYAPLRADRAALITATRRVLASLKGVREGVLIPPPTELTTPNRLERHSLVCVGIVAVAAYIYAEWLPQLLARRHDAVRAAHKVAGDLARFWHTHVTEPLTLIGQDLFHGTPPTIDHAQVPRRALLTAHTERRCLHWTLQRTESPTRPQEALPPMTRPGSSATPPMTRPGSSDLP